MISISALLFQTSESESAHCGKDYVIFLFGITFLRSMLPSSVFVDFQCHFLLEKCSGHINAVSFGGDWHVFIPATVATYVNFCPKLKF